MPAAIVPELDSEQYMIGGDDLVDTEGLVQMTEGSVRTKDVLEFLKKAYCGNITSDLSYLSTEKREWMAKALEEAVNKVWRFLRQV